MAEGKKRGFASMSPEKQREIASRGGKAAHAKGTAHEFNPESARDAGRKGGLTVSQNREHMSSIGREGGRRRGMNARKMATQNTEQQVPEFTTDVREAEGIEAQGSFRAEEADRENRGRQAEPAMADRSGEGREMSIERGEDLGDENLDRDRGEGDRKE